MSRQNMTGPLSVLIFGIIVIVMLLAGSDNRTSASVRRENASPTLTPCDDADDDCLDERDDLTATAEAATSYPPASGTATATRTPTGTPGTRTPTVTGTQQATATNGTPTAPTAFVAPTTAPGVALTPTTIPADALTCAPGVPLTITGEGPPRAAYLLFFGQRAVGGGSVEPDGHFSTKLIVGQERAGIYNVAVRLRGTNKVLREFTCAVPYVTPTPVPARRGF